MNDTTKPRVSGRSSDSKGELRRTRRERGRDGSGCGPSVVQSVAGEDEDYKPWEGMLCGVTTETSVGSRTAFLQALFAFYLVDPFDKKQGFALRFLKVISKNNMGTNPCHFMRFNIFARLILPCGLCV